MPSLTQFGFVLADRAILVDDVRVRGIGRSFDKLAPSALAEHNECVARGERFDTAAAVGAAPRRDVYFDGEGRVPTAIVRLRDVSSYEAVPGPAILIDETQTLLIEPRCEARMLSQAVLIQVSS